MTARPVQVTPLMRFAFNVQVFLLKRNWMGPAGKIIMVITTKGRKSGKSFSLPIGYLQDGDTYLAYSRGSGSNWFHNVLANPAVTLVVRGKTIQARGRQITDKAEALQAIELYKREQPSSIERFWNISPKLEGEQLLTALDNIVLMRFLPS